MNIYEQLYARFGSQTEIALEIGVAQKTVHTWSRGTYPTLANAQKIANILNITVGEVFDNWEQKKEA